jgi:hypothetical protein
MKASLSVRARRNATRSPRWALCQIAALGLCQIAALAFVPDCQQATVRRGSATTRRVRMPAQTTREGKSSVD